MIKVVGTQHKSGSFKNDNKETVEYDNIYLFITDDSQNGEDGINGAVADSFKIPTKKFSNMFGNKITPETSASLVGQSIEFVSCVKNGVAKVTGIRMVK